MDNASSAPTSLRDALADAINALPVLSTRYDLDSGASWIDRDEVLKLIDATLRATVDQPAEPVASKFAMETFSAHVRAETVLHGRSASWHSFRAGWQAALTTPSAGCSDALAALQRCVNEIQYLRRRIRKSDIPVGHWLVLQDVQEQACAVLNEAAREEKT